MLPTWINISSFSQGFSKPFFLKTSHPVAVLRLLRCSSLGIRSGFSSRLYPCQAVATCCCESRNHSCVSEIFLPVSLVDSSPFPGLRPFHSLPTSWRSSAIKRTCRSAPESRRIGGKTMCLQRRPPRGGRHLAFPPLVPWCPWCECFCHLTTVFHFLECPDTDKGGDWIGTHSHL